MRSTAASSSFRRATTTCAKGLRTRPYKPKEEPAAYLGELPPQDPAGAPRSTGRRQARRSSAVVKPPSGSPARRAGALAQAEFEEGFHAPRILLVVIGRRSASAPASPSRGPGNGILRAETSGRFQAQNAGERSEFGSQTATRRAIGQKLRSWPQQTGRCFPECRPRPSAAPTHPTPLCGLRDWVEGLYVDQGPS